MSGIHGPFPRPQPGQDGTDPDVGDSWSGDPFPSVEERAYAEALIAADVAEFYAWLPPADDPAFDALAWELGMVVLHGEDARVAQVAATLVDRDRSPEVFCDDSHLLDQLTGPATPGELGTLARIDVEALAHPQDRLAYLQRLEKVEALLAALKVTGLVAVAGESASLSSMDEAHVATEVALARRVGQRSAYTSIEVARALSSRFPQFLTALQAGEISEWHCRELVSSTRSVTDDDVRRQVADATLAKATRMTPREFAGEVAKAIARFDHDLTARIETAREDRRVWCTPLPDGMGFLGLIHDWSTVQAMHSTITADGRTLQLDRGGAAAVRAGDDDARADASRADAMAARLLGTVAEDGSVSWDRSTQQVVSMTLVMDLDTLQGEIDRFALLDGQPIPAGLARDLAEGARLWRRAVTDPITGVLLDYGTEQYLPEPLRRYVKARDGVCGTPICSRTKRLEMDHAEPFPEGTTSAGNCHAWCTTCHQLKTERRLRFVDTKPDGSATLITAWGQRFSIPPRPFLHDPNDHRPEATYEPFANDVQDRHDRPPPTTSPPANARPDDDPPPF